MRCLQQTSILYLNNQKRLLSVIFSGGWGLGASTGSANDGSNDGGVSPGDVVFLFEEKDREDNSIKYGFEGAYNQIYPTYDFVNRCNKVEAHFPTKNDLIILAKYENVHVEQSKQLGPLYLPVYLGSGAWYKWNWMEKRADKGGNNAYKNRGLQDHNKPWSYRKE